ncbi:MAG: AAA family ATPase, partial [Thaumarchaeota archaeon]|nr:AAA family ATPase [Nitrososphaerota archaeon]
PLKNTFALIGSYRNYNEVESIFNLNQPKFEKLKAIKAKIIEDSTRISKNEEPIIFEYLKNKLSFRLNNIESDLYEGKVKNPNSISAFEFLKKEQEYGTLNKLLNDYLGLSLEITHKEETMEYHFNFVDLKEEKIALVQDLSAGEKGIIHFIFSIYGYDLESGVMVIDEPELHLHPQIQQKYLDIISNTIQYLDLQFIIATHSPIFVNEETIEHTYRFYKSEDDFTQIKTCSKIDADMKSRIQMLNYTNSAIVFFVEKVILTEGYRDKIFFKKYLENYKARHKKDISKIEILAMGGAGEYEKWHKFLEEFEIKTYYIGDADNLKHSYISHNSANWNTLFSGAMLRNDILSLKQNAPAEYQRMVNEIKQHYASDIYLLQNGAFEDYFEQMTNESKSTKGVTSFCLSDKFENWINSSYYHPYAVEIEGIMFKIVN